jgi:hypothetical protein
MMSTNRSAQIMSVSLALTDQDPRLGVGGNNPPTQAEILREQLEIEAEALMKRRDELLAAAERVPALIDNDELAGRVGDFVKQLTGAHKAAETARVAAKEPYLEETRVVDSLFRQITDPLARVKKAIEARLGVYLKQKADEERRQREEAARLAREKAEAEWRAAQEAEKARLAEQSKVSAETVIGHIDAAQQYENEADQLAAAAAAKAADLSRVRGDYGSVQSLRTTWDFRILDLDAIPLDKIRPYLPATAIETAIRGFVRAGHHELAGVHIFEKHSAAVR